MALIGLDVGGTGVKAVAFDHSGAILGSAYREYDMIHPASGCYEYDPRAILAAAKGVLRECAAACNEKILGIGVSSFGESTALLDENGEVLCNTLMYLDTRGQNYLDELNANYDPYEFRAQMGTRPRINHTIVKLRVLEDANPGLLSRVKTVCFMADYVLYSLGGEHVTDYSVASTTGALDMQKQCWNESLWRWAGLSADVLPRLVSPGTCVGTISAAAARELGIDEGAKLVIGGLDHVPSSIGCGVTQKGQMMDAIGTVDCYFLVTDTIDPHEYDGDFLFLPHYTENCFGGLTANMAGGVLLKWFREHLGKYEKEMWKRDGLDFYVEYEKQMAKEPTDLIVLPRFAGYSDNMADRAGILNMTLSTTNEELYRAFMEGETYEMYTMLLSYGQQIDSLTAVGGAAQCDTYMQIRADVFNLPVRTVESSQPGALGDAMAAGVAAGVFESIEQAVKTCVRTRKVFTPDAERHAFYMQQYDKYLRIYEALRSL